MLVDRFHNIILHQHLFTKKDRLLIAVSGGVDSVVLCELCKQAGFEFGIAHCNFQLRGAESERDEDFVNKLAEKYKVAIFVKKFETEKYAEENKYSIQEAARKLRYDWFNEILSQPSSAPAGNSYQFLLTAHHADDNIETLLMNFFRGTGIPGLTAIPVKTGKIRRPLLCFSKQELIAFAVENKIEFVEDSSNASDKYTRNFLRNELIPRLEAIYPMVKQNLSANIKRFTAIEELYDLAVGQVKKKLCKTRKNEIHIPVKQLMEFNNHALIYEIIKDFGFSEKQIEELIKLSTSESGSYISSPASGYRIIKHRHWFIISPASPVDAENIIIEKTDMEIGFAAGKLKFDITSNTQHQVTNNMASLDARHINYPLLLRKWKPADYFYPLGMKKKKKINRFFIDQKLSKPEKEKAWVIESNKKIIWVVGYRIDERFKITEKTKSVLAIQLTPA